MSAVHSDGPVCKCGSPLPACPVNILPEALILRIHLPQSPEDFIGAFIVVLGYKFLQCRDFLLHLIGIGGAAVLIRPAPKTLPSAPLQTARRCIVIHPIACFGYLRGFQKSDCIIVVQCAHTDTCDFAYFLYCPHPFPSRVSPF